MQLPRAATTVAVLLLLCVPIEAAEPPTVRRVATGTPPEGKVTIGEAEYVHVSELGAVFDARIDTGATTTSIHAADVVEFERDGEPWVRFVVKGRPEEQTYPLERPVAGVAEIKKRGEEGFTRRPAVSLVLVMGGVTREVKVNLADRTGFEYALLIGRDFLRGLAVVDVSAKHTQATPGSPVAAEEGG